MDELAFDYVYLSDEASKLLSWGLMFLGASISIGNRTNKKIVSRSQYWLLLLLVTFVVGVSQFVWVYYIDAIKHGYLSALLLTDVIVGVLAGFAIGHIALGRSLDTYGKSWKAIYSVIPIANLILIFSPPLIPRKKTYITFLNIAFGFVIIIGLIATRATIENKMQEASERTDAGLIETEGMLKAMGVEKTINQIAENSNYELPLIIDETTSLTEIKAQGNVLVRMFQIEQDLELDIPYMIKIIDSNICNNATLSLIIRNGGAIHEVYFKTLDSVYFEHTVTAENCKF